MNKLLVRALAVTAIAAITAFVVACGGDDDDNGDATQAPSTPPSTQAASTEPAAGETPTTTSGDPTVAGTTSAGTPAPAATVAPGGATVQAGAAGLVDSGGFSLYVFASDVADSGTSACVGGCSSAWPPLTAEGAPTAGPGVTGTLATITRMDGSLQITYEGKPLYRWINDVNPGDTTGTAIMNWSLAQP